MAMLIWIYFILFILVYLFLILGSKDLKKHNFVSTKLLFIIGILLLVWYILLYICYMFPSPTETIIRFIYLFFLGFGFIRFGIIYQVLHIILGIGFIKVGSNNREQGGKVMLVGGVLYLLACILSTIGWIFDLNYIVGFFGFPIPSAIFYIISIMYWLFNIVSLAAVILIFIFSIFTKRPLFIVFGALFLAVYSIQFSMFINIYFLGLVP